MKTINNTKQINGTYSKGVVENIILWIVLFTSFVTLLVFIIDYSNLMRVKDNSDAIAIYSAKMINQAKEMEDIVKGINKIKSGYFKQIDENDIKCEVTGNNSYQVIFEVTSDYKGTFLSQPMAVRKVVFNELDSTEKRCKLVLKKKEKK